MNWQKVKPYKTPSEDDPIQQQLADIYGIEDISHFLKPKASDMHSAYLIDNIKEARDKIIEHIKSGNKISVYSDVDPDGCTSTAIIFNYLRQITDNIEYFFSQRSEGHGIEKGLNKIPEGTKLLIIVDSSTSSDVACAVIKSLGIDIIVIDHHPAETVNNHAIILNNQLCDYPNKQLSGAGMCYKMISVLDDSFGLGTVEDFIDLAGVGIHGDMMDMKVMENRYFVDQCLRNIKNTGLKSLFKAAKINAENLCSNDLAFSITPLLNGASRMGKLELVLELLTTDDPIIAYDIAKQIQKLNNERKKNQKQYVEKIMHDINTKDKIVAIIDNEVDSGFRGLIAQDVAVKCKKPTMFLGEDGNGNLSGSFRSYADFNLKNALNQTTHVLDTAGHQQAGGVSFPANKLKEVVHELNNLIEIDDQEQNISYHMEVHVSDLSRTMIEKVMDFNRIVGKGMPESKFKVTGLCVNDKKLMGKNLDTIKIECDDLVLMKFRSNEDFFNDVPVYQDIEAIGTLNINKFFNFGIRQWVITDQMFIEDYNIVE